MESQNTKSVRENRLHVHKVRDLARQYIVVKRYDIETTILLLVEKGADLSTAQNEAKMMYEAFKDEENPKALKSILLGIMCIGLGLFELYNKIHHGIRGYGVIIALFAWGVFRLYVGIKRRR